MVYKWYFSCQLEDGLCHRSHLLGEPEKSVDHMGSLHFFSAPHPMGSHGEPETTTDSTLQLVPSKHPGSDGFGQVYSASGTYHFRQNVVFFLNEVPGKNKQSN